MSSLPIRDQVKDHLLTPKNAAIVIIDFQPVQVNSITSMDRQTLVNNIVALAGCGKRVLDPLKSASVERRINNLQRLVSTEKGFFCKLLVS